MDNIDEGGELPVQTSTVESRTAQRRATQKSARLVLNNGHTTLNCEVTDLSETGARLQIGVPTPLPSEFFVYFQDGRKRPAELMWTAGTRLGVRFADVEPAEQVAGDVDLLAKVDEIEAAVGALKAELRRHLGRG